MLTARVLAVALRPLLRGLPLGLVVGLLASSDLPIVVAAARGGTDLGMAVVAAALLAGAAVAFAADEPLAMIAGAAPVPLWQRRGVRLVGLFAGIVVAAAVVVWVVERYDPGALHDRSARLAELAAISGLAIAVAGVAERLGMEGPALLGAASGPLAVLTSTVLANQFHWFPSLGTAGDARRWWTVAGVGWAVAVWSSRDPYARATVRARRGR